ncbi:MAG: DUF6456 domain-containing protein [Ruegeria sp.]
MEDNTAFTVPNWVPEGAKRYLAHTEEGRSIRDLARSEGCHASTVLRQIRRIETRRDDPLVDAALQTLADSQFMVTRMPETDDARVANGAAAYTESVARDEVFDREALRILRRLCEAGAVLAVAEDMDKAVVVRDNGRDDASRTAIVACAIAQALALKGWISCDNPGRISRYRITSTGRSALTQLIAEGENKARGQRENGMEETQAAFQTRQTTTGSSSNQSKRIRYCIAESPLIALSRRRDRDGRPFLEESLVRAGERLREDFELAQIGPKVALNWDSFLTGGGLGDANVDVFAGAGSSQARDRVARALSDLGPGLSDVTLRCCCYLEGLELAEKRMGWSARSGKIVLRIALQRLKRHYDNQAECDRMIG